MRARCLEAAVVVAAIAAAALDRPPAAVAGLTRMADGTARAGEIADGIGRPPQAVPRLRWVALPPLRAIADGEPPALEPADPIEGVKRLFGAEGRCGAGDIARDAIRELGESP
jgi:hypothetical protein